MLRDQADPSKNRGYLKSPKDEMDQINLNIQRFRIEHPELSDVIAPAVEGEPVQVDWSRLDPQQTRFVKEMITGRPQPETVSPVAPGTPQPTRRKGATPLSNRRRPLPSQSAVPSTRMPAYQGGVPPSGRGR